MSGFMRDASVKGFGDRNEDQAASVLQAAPPEELVAIEPPGLIVIALRLVLCCGEHGKVADVLARPHNVRLGAVAHVRELGASHRGPHLVMVGEHAPRPPRRRDLV